MQKTASSPASRKRRTTTNRAAQDLTPDKLIDAAGRVFAERGYHATTVREICKRAGANVAAVNYHFGDKQGLYMAVLKHSVRASKVEAIQNAFNQQAPPEEILRTIIKLRLQSAVRADLPDWHFRLMIHEFSQPSPVLSRVINEVSLPIYERMLDLVGRISGLPPHHEKTRLCVHSLMGQVFLYVLQRPFLARVWPELKMNPEQVERIAGHIADFSLAYIKQDHSQEADHLKSPKKKTQGKDL
ncbi:MAG TPA: CerR family C-terminal domain-containing protein [Candidatus Solibacter sp.]|nr:CerR family C-terminal domain-containing protein [Candidatus Solibacter sp.]